MPEIFNSENQGFSDFPTPARWLEMMFKAGSPLYSYEVIRESGENVLYVNYLGASFSPSIVDYPEVMAKTLDILAENSDISRLVFVQQRNYSYDFPQIKLLFGVATLHDFLIKQEGILMQEKLSFLNQKDLSSVYTFLTT